jgi:thermostable 8-oxoguanine DNA glycosylase
VLERREHPPEVLRLVMDLMVSRSFWRESRISKLHDRLEGEGIRQITIDSLKSEEFKKILLEFDKNSKLQLLRHVENFLDQLEGHSMKAWLEQRHAKRQSDEQDACLKVIGFGPKGIDILLRDCGFYDRAPIDIHEQRFLVRTGVFQRYARFGDPTSKSDFHAALTNFCHVELTELEVNSHHMDKPGIADLAIWHFCAREEADVCGDRPECAICPLNQYCEFGRFHASQPIR